MHLLNLKVALSEQILQEQKKKYSFSLATLQGTTADNFARLKVL